MPKSSKDFNVDSVRVVKVLGGGLDSSRVVRGMVFGRQPEGVVKSAKKAKVAVYTCGLDISQTETKGTVLLKKAEELLDFTRGEEKQLEGVSCQSASLGYREDTDIIALSTSKRLPTLVSNSLSPVRV